VPSRLLNSGVSDFISDRAPVRLSGHGPARARTSRSLAMTPRPTHLRIPLGPRYRHRRIP
jgi:hypothetical protein